MPFTFMREVSIWPPPPTKNREDRGKEGWLHPLRKYREATIAGAEGVVRSKEIVLEFERTTPSAPFKGTGIFFDGASTPPLPRRGVCFAQAFSKIKCVYFPGIKPASSNFDTTESTVTVY